MLRLCRSAFTGVPMSPFRSLSCITVLIPLLAACASPSPEFFGSVKSEVMVEGRAYTVFRDENRVQVIRHGYAGPRDRRDIPGQMILAVEQATGCRAVIESFQGDSGERRGRIAC